MSADGLCKRIIPCLDVQDGVTVKGIKFGNLRRIGDPVELALFYQEQGADELTFLDISASNENRSTVIDLVAAVAKNLSIPFSVGGGVSSLETVKRLLSSGADKVSINTAAVKRPELIEEIASVCGSQCCVVAIDVKRNIGASLLSPFMPDAPNRPFEVVINGGKVPTGRDAVDWALECVARGAGEILLTSWDQDGTLEGFDIELVRTFAQLLSVPVIASGGARDPASFVEVFQAGKADAALAASIFHDELFTIRQVKEELQQAGVKVRPC